MDQAHCLAPGLFRSLKKGERKKSKLDVTYNYGNRSIRFWGPEPLGADDMRVLQGLVAMAAVVGEKGRGIVLNNSSTDERARQLRLWLDLKWDAVEQDVMVAKGSFHELAKEIGYATDSGGSQKIIRESIERLWAVSVILEENGRRFGSKILSKYSSDESQGKVFVALSPRITQAIMGLFGYTRIDLVEARGLKTDPAHLLHQRLSAWIDPGTSRTVGIDKLVDYVWHTAANPNTTKWRRGVIKKALSELVVVGWRVKEDAGENWTITRPKAPAPENE